MRAQRGQSMVEYLVVLGVTGAVLIATLTDVGNIFDSVHNNYSTQSREMMRVQLYDSHRVRYSSAAPVEDYDDGSPEPSNPDYQLPAAELPMGLFDEFGELIGRYQDGVYVNDQGEVIATCNELGVCVDNDGNAVSARPVGYNGKELPLLALYDSNGNMLGFAYFNNGHYYHPISFRGLTLDSGVVIDSRKEVKRIFYGTAQDEVGYESEGRIYSRAQAFQQPNIISASQRPTAQAEQLLRLVWPTGAGPANWDPRIAPCVVMTNAQMADVRVISIAGVTTPVSTLGSSGTNALSDPSKIRHTKDASGDCRAAQTATYGPNGVWLLSSNE